MSLAPPSEEAQKLLQSTLVLDYPAGCSATRAPGQLCGPCLQLEAINTKLYALQEEVNKLLLIRTEVKELLNQHHDPLTRHLPVEITSNIFAIYTENSNSDFDPEYPTIKYGPLLLGSVSKSWREIAFATPHLWNTVNILIPSIDKLPTKVELMKQWLDRSRQLPLYLSLVPRKSASDVIEEDASLLIPFFNVLHNVAPRWYKLVLGIPPTLYSTFLGELTCALALNTLKFVHGLWGGGQFILPHTPSLKHLDIQSTLFLPEISIDWSNLTTFKDNYVSMDELFEVLRLARVLESFTLFHGLNEDVGEYPLPVTPFAHSTLRRLYLGSSDEADIEPSRLETLLNLAVFPSLERFGYGSSSHNFFPNGALRSLFNRSHCQLTHFYLSGNLEDVTSDELISILSDLPMIRHLKLEDRYSRPLERSSMSDELLQRLAPIHHDEFTHTGRLLPRLESLEFLGYKTFSWNYLASLVCTNPGPNSIRRISFRVYFRGEMEFIDAHSVARFKGARDAGIEIDIVNETLPQSFPAIPPLDAAGNRVYPVNLLP